MTNSEYPPFSWGYPQLAKTIRTAEKRLARHIGRYNKPVDYYYAESITISIIREILMELGERYLGPNEYIDRDHPNIIPIGAYPNNRTTRLLRHMYEKEKERVRNDLWEVAQSSIAHLKYPLLHLSEITMKKHGKIVDTQGYWEERLRVRRAAMRRELGRVCKQFLASKDLSLDSFIDGDEITAPEPGMYFIMLEDKIQYIGSSRNIKQRLSNHEILREIVVPNSYGDDYINPVSFVVWFADYESAKKKERELIAVAQPPFNQRSK